MDVIDEESISTADNLHDKSQYPIESTSNDHNNSSMMMMETFYRDNNANSFADPSSSSTSGVRDSRHDSPREQDDHMMKLEDSNSMGMGRLAFIPPSIRTSSVAPSSAAPGVMRARVITGDNGATRHGDNSASNEEPVALAPRFGSTHPLQNAVDERARQEEESGPDHSLFSISGSMSSEFLEDTVASSHVDYTTMYAYQRRIAVEVNSPRSTTAAQDFMREVPCPHLPSIHDSSGPREGPSSSWNHQRPPFHPPTTSTTPTPSSHPTLPFEHFQPPPQRRQPTTTTVLSPTIPSIGSFCDGGREKPVISRCFAWSQDSQDERRITKRARMHVAPQLPSSLSNDTLGSAVSSMVLSPSSALVGNVVKNSTKTSADSSHFGILEEEEEIYVEEHKSDQDSPTHKVHWEEKVEHSHELMSRASVAPQVLFASNEENETTDEAMMQPHDPRSSSPPLIDTAAHSASHYSFESL